ncbi:hypothetical protein [Rhizobium phaseoli]|uniref:hypothetical protein n=1 Tax=Rhizobium phaseoli TaxID=396 RepID=UPI001CEDE860|nr:hypothetical protein [Rhizobium phaseoli]
MVRELQPDYMPPKLKIEWIQTSTDGLSTGTKMSSIRKNTYDELISLRDYRGPVVTVECKDCRRSGELDRKKLVKQYGASLTFMQLRRRLALGCSNMNSEDGIDRCTTWFPCLADARFDEQEKIT